MDQGQGNGKGRIDFDIQPIDETTESFRNFVRRYRNSPATQKSYTGWFRRYVAYSNIPQVKAKIGIDVGDNTNLLLFDDVRKIERHVKNFLDYHYEVSHLSPKTLISYYDAVKRFYKSNGIMLQGDSKDYVGTANVPANFDTPYTYEEIHKLLDKAGERERCIILLLCSSGIRRGDSTKNIVSTKNLVGGEGSHFRLQFTKDLSMNFRCFPHNYYTVYIDVPFIRNDE